MLKVSSYSVFGYKEMEVPFSILCTNEGINNSVAILLPGEGYTVQAPLLHYSTGVFLNRSFDVLQVNYRYNDKKYDDFSMDELIGAIKYDVKKVIDKAFRDKSYENVYFVGKSLGTIAMSSELKRDIFKDAKAVWLTPLLTKDDVFETMVESNNKGLCFIGDKDRFYIQERYEQLLNNPNIASRLVPDVNHSLQYDTNPVRSIDVLKSIIKEINEF
jgi:hypothetical protein